MQLLLWFLVGKIFTIIVGSIYYKQLPFPYKLVFYHTIIATLTETVGYCMTASGIRSNVWLFNLFMPIELWFMGLAALFLVNRKLHKIFYALLILGTAIWVKTIVTDSIFKFANIPLISYCAILTVIYISVLLNNSLFSTKEITRQPIFWLAVSTVLYFSCVIPVMGLFNYLSEDRPLARQLNNIIYVLDIIRYPLVGVSFMLFGRQKQVEVKTV